jgi:hypothetical protein
MWLDVSSRTAIEGWAIWNEPRWRASQLEPNVWMGADDQRALRAGAHGGIGFAHQGKRLAHRRRQSTAGFCQDDLARPSQEERHADPLLEYLDLVAHRRLGHAQLFGSLGETGVARGSLEGTDG